MAFVILQEQNLTPTWHFNGDDTCTLRIFASQAFYEASTGEYIAQGSPTNPNSYYQSYTCTITDGIVRLPNVTLATTTDSTVPNAVYTAILFDSTGVPRYPFLSQFYVDPYLFQIPAYSSVLVTGAGTTSVIGTYTYRGQLNDFGYYNLQGQADSTTLNCIKVATGAWLITNGAGVTEYDGLDTPTAFPWETLYEEAAGDLPAPIVAQQANLVTSTWEVLTISNSGFATVPPGWPGPFLNAAQTTQLIDSKIGDGTTPFAAELIAGKTELTVDPDIQSRPIAIGANDRRFLAITSAAYIEEYGCNQAGLDAAIAVIGSTRTQLIVTCPVTVTTNTTIPANVQLVVQGPGRLTIASGITLTISSMAPQAPTQIFFGPGNAVFAKNATGGAFHIEWWAGITPSSDDTHAFAQATLSRVANTNGILNLGPDVWKTTNFDFGDNGIVRGSGNSTAGAQGTVLTVPSGTTNSAVVKIQGAFRNRCYENLTISAGSTTSNNCLLMTGSVPDSGINACFNNVTFHGTGTNSTSQVYLVDADGAHAWECINVQFNHCQWSTPIGTIAFHLDTVNSLIYFNGRQSNISIGSTFGYLEYAGWITDDTADNRGVPGLTPTITTDRTIAGTISVGTKIVNLTSGSVSLNDVGQKTIIHGTFGTNITGVISASQFTVADNSPSTFTAQTVEIFRYSPDPTGALAVWHLVNGHNTLQINNTTDEGFQYFLINDASDTLSPVNIEGGIIQSLIQLNAAMVLNVNGCRLVSQLFEDIDGIQASISMSSQNSLSSTNAWSVVLLKPRIWGVNNGTSTVPVELNYGFNGSSFAPVNRQTFGIPTWFVQDVAHAGNLSTPIVAIGAADITTGGTNKVLLRLTRLEATSELPDFWYDFEHDYDTGFELRKGNQAFPNRGYVFDATVYSDTTFNGGLVSPATITGNDGNYDPGTSALFIRLATSATWSLSGLGIASSLSPQVSGEIHQIWNVGANNLILLHQNAGSSAGNRFLMDTGANMTLLPNEGVDVWYDLVTGRWRVSKKNITGLTSSGTLVTSSLPMTVAGALIGSSTASFMGVTNVGPTNTFKMSVTPSSTNTGLAVLGSSTVGIDLGEAAGVLGLVAPDIEIDGAVGIVGSTNITGGFRQIGTGGIGYGTGSGSTIAQITSRTTGVTINNICGAITLFSTAGSATPASFTVTNSQVAASDTITLSQKTGTDAYGLYISHVAAGSFQITVVDLTGTTSEAPVINFAVWKGVVS